MSEQPPQPPPTLSYHKPDRPGMPVGVQTFLGFLCTMVVLCVLCVACGFASIFVNSQSGATIAIISFFVAVFAMAFLFTRRLARNPDRRGWVLGIYIGMGLAGLFWGYCGLVVHSLSGPH